MPDHPNPLVARVAPGPPPRFVSSLILSHTIGRDQTGRAQRLLHRSVHGMVLVIASRLLHQFPTTLVLEDDEIANKVEKAALLEQAFDGDLQLGQEFRREVLTCNRAPRREPL